MSPESVFHVARGRDRERVGTQGGVAALDGDLRAQDAERVDVGASSTSQDLLVLFLRLSPGLGGPGNGTQSLCIG